MTDLDFSFAGIQASTFGIKAAAHVPLLPTRRDASLQVPGRDGLYDPNTGTYEPRVISLDCFIKAADRATLETSLAAAAKWLTGTGYLVLGKSQTLRWQARVFDGIDLSRAAKTGRFAISFACDPWPEEIEERTVLVGGATVDYGSAAPFYPTITVTLASAVDYIKVMLQSSGKYVQVNNLALLVGFQLLAGDVLVIDMAKGVVTKNGLAVMRCVGLDSTFFAVPSGSQTITITPTGHAATMKYHRRQYFG